MSESYVVRRVEFFGRSVKVCMQNRNGPCPLLAIANVLSLRNELKLRSGIREITQSDLITAIVDLLLERSKHYEPAYAADLQQNISDCFPVLQKLTTGIDVNVKFHNSHAFEPTPEVAVFDLLGIPLVHGWLVDPQDTTTAAVFGNKSYNELMELLLLGLGDAEVEALAAGPLRSLSITAHQHLHDQQQLRASSLTSSTQQHQLESSSGSTTNTSQQPSQQQQRQPEHNSAATSAIPAATAAAGGLNDLPQLPRVATTAAAGSGPGPAAQSVESSAAAPQGEDAVIEQLVEEMLACVCCENTPGKIELGDSPTRNTSLTRRLAFEGPGPSCLNSSSHSGLSAAAAVTAAAAAAASNGAAAAAVTGGGGSAGVQQQEQQQQSQQQKQAAADAGVVRCFMEAHCSQLTPYGLSHLAESLKEHQLAVFFRNNHFNTLFKYEGGVYLLVTDQGYECEPDIVWERLDSVNGDTTFCTGSFTPFVPHTDPSNAAGPLSYSQAAAGGLAADSSGQGLAAATDLDAAIAASLAAADGEGGLGAIGGSGHHQHGGGLGFGDDHEDADFALALQLQLQEEEAARVAAERRQQQQQQGGSGRDGAAATQQQQQPQQQQQGGQQQPAQVTDSLASSVRQMGRRIATGVDRAAANLQQQRHQYAQQQAAQYAAQQQQQQQQLGQGQQGMQQQHQRQYMEQQRRHKHGSSACSKRPQQQEDKCSIM